MQVDVVVPKFEFDVTESRRMRRGAFLPAVLIVPLATMYGLDSSKSQPTHFLITLLIGLVCAAVVVAISRSAVDRRIRDLSKTSLTSGDDRLIWKSGMGQSELDLDTVSRAIVRQRRGSVRSITLKLDNGRSVELQSYTRMDDLLEDLRPQMRNASFEIEKWFKV